MSFFTARVVAASQLTSENPAHIRQEAIARYARPVWRSFSLPQSERDGATAHFPSDAVYASHDERIAAAASRVIHLSDGRITDDEGVAAHAE